MEDYIYYCKIRKVHMRPMQPPRYYSTMLKLSTICTHFLQCDWVQKPIVNEHLYKKEISVYECSQRSRLCLSWMQLYHLKHSFGWYKVYPVADLLLFSEHFPILIGLRNPRIIEYSTISSQLPAIIDRTQDPKAAFGENLTSLSPQHYHLLPSTSL